MQKIVIPGLTRNLTKGNAEPGVTHTSHWARLLAVRSVKTLPSAVILPNRSARHRLAFDRLGLYGLLVTILTKLDYQVVPRVSSQNRNIEPRNSPQCALHKSKHD